MWFGSHSIRLTSLRSRMYLNFESWGSWKTARAKFKTRRSCRLAHTLFIFNWAVCSVRAHQATGTALIDLLVDQSIIQWNIRTCNPCERILLLQSRRAYIKIDIQKLILHACDGSCIIIRCANIIITKQFALDNN